MNKFRYIAAISIYFMLMGQGWAQSGVLTGFVYDMETGAHIPSAAVYIPNTPIGTMTNDNGFFSLVELPAGQHTIEVSCLGYSPGKEVISLSEGQELRLYFRIKPQVFNLDEATITATKKRWKQTNLVSMHRLTPATLQRIPSMGAQPDLGDYLQVLPGVILTGDKGGQFYIRGGSAIHNLTRLDGLTVINPFHSIGFISVFDTDILRTADIHTAGFDARFGGRISSVIDLKTRTGNKKEYKANLGASTHGYSLMTEGPIMKMKEDVPTSISYLLSTKASYFDRTAPVIYPWLDSLGMPYQYKDFFGKLSFVTKRGDQLDVFGLHYEDEAKYEGIIESDWQNTAGGFRFTLIPHGGSWLWEYGLYLTDYKARIFDYGNRPRNTRYNSYDLRMTLHHYKNTYEWIWGIDIEAMHTLHEFVGVDQVLLKDAFFTTDASSFFTSKITAGNWLLEPSFRLHYYATHTHASLEPRFKLKYDLLENWSLNLSGGLYSQQVLSTTSELDVVNLFQGFYTGVSMVQDYFHNEPVRGLVQKSWHIVGGSSWLTNNNIKFTLEGYVKNFYRLINYNRNKIYRDSKYTSDIIEYLKKYFIIETGLGYGLDFMMDWQSDHFNLYCSYSLGFVTREDEYYQYTPHFDRRHNFNLLGGYAFGKNKSWSAKARWNLGSGFPFTQTWGYYEDITFLDGGLLLDINGNGTAGIWFGPLNEGRLPWYHRLDLSLQKEMKVFKTKKLSLTASLINVYNRANVFYFDRFEYQRIDQFPIMPNLGMKIEL